MKPLLLVLLAGLLLGFGLGWWVTHPAKPADLTHSLATVDSAHARLDAALRAQRDSLLARERAASLRVDSLQQRDRASRATTRLLRTALDSLRGMALAQPDTAPVWQAFRAAEAVIDSQDVVIERQDSVISLQDARLRDFAAVVALDSLRLAGERQRGSEHDALYQREISRQAVTIRGLRLKSYLGSGLGLAAVLVVLAVKH